jgi:hypothetical protein
MIQYKERECILCMIQYKERECILCIIQHNEKECIHIKFWSWHEGKGGEKNNGKKHTHLAWVSAGPWPAFAVYSVKYCGTETPKKRAIPNMNMVLIEFVFTNWRKETPVAAANVKQGAKL